MSGFTHHKQYETFLINCSVWKTMHPQKNTPAHCRYPVISVPIHSEIINHLLSWMKLYMMWGIPLILCLIDEDLYSNKGVPPTQTCYIVFKCSTFLWDGKFGGVVSAMFTWMAGPAHILGEMLKKRRSNAVQRKRGCYIEIYETVWLTTHWKMTVNDTAIQHRQMFWKLTGRDRDLLSKQPRKLPKTESWQLNQLVSLTQLKWETVISGWKIVFILAST